MPVSATTRLQGSMTKSLDAFSTLLDILCSTFLLEQPSAKENRMPLAQAVKAHGAAFKSLKANLAEAKNERLIDPRMRGAKLELYDAALGSMARLAQHLAAMRSSTRLQEALLRANREGRIDLDKAEKRNHHMAESVIYELGDLPTISIEEEADVEQSVQLFLQLQRMTGDDMDNLVVSSLAGSGAHARPNATKLSMPLRRSLAPAREGIPMRPTSQGHGRLWPVPCETLAGHPAALSSAYTPDRAAAKVSMLRIAMGVAAVKRSRMFPHR